VAIIAIQRLQTTTNEASNFNLTKTETFEFAKRFELNARTSSAESIVLSVLMRKSIQRAPPDQPPQNLGRGMCPLTFGAVGPKVPRERVN
jgi:hypothetical protein